MLLSKLKKVENRVKIIDNDQHFHLDEQQQNLAFEAKLQLQQCSKQISNEMMYQQKAILNKDFLWGTNIEVTLATNATDNDSKQAFNKKRQSFYRNRNQNGNSDNYFSYRKHKVCGSTFKSPVKSQTQAISCKIQGNFFSVFKKQNCITKYIEQLQILNRKKVVNSPRILSGSFRCYTSNNARNSKDGNKSFRPSSSLRRKKNFSNSIEEYIEKNTPRASYSFNDAIKGDRINLLEHVELHQRYTQRPKKMLTQHNQNFSTSRQHKTNLRPQFMRLVQKIKQKQQKKSKINSSTSVKGRRIAF